MADALEKIREKSREIVALCHEKGVPPDALTIDRFRELGGKCSNAYYGQAIAMARESWDQSLAAPDGLFLERATIKVGDNWLKYKVDQKRRYEALLEAIEALPSKVTPRKGRIPAPKTPASADLMAIYPLGDPHIGMMSWAPETGKSWDLKAAEAVFGGAFDRLTQRGDATETAWLLNLGDFWHSDDDSNRTRRSGHHLDVDGRFGKVVDCGVRIMRHAIDACLRTHQRVRVTNCIGNHDDMSSRWLSRVLMGYYHNEPRVEIDNGDAPFAFHRFGANLFGATHGHNTKAQELPRVMAQEDESKPHWSECEYFEWFCGHIHHMRQHDLGNVVVGHYRTLAPRDYYAATRGLTSFRDLNRLVYQRRGNLFSSARITAEAVETELAEAA